MTSGLLRWVLVAVIMPSAAVGQVVSADRPQTIMSNGASHGFFAGGDVLVTELAGESAMGLRFEGGWIGAHRLVAGLGVSALIPPSRRKAASQRGAVPRDAGEVHSRLLAAAGSVSYSERHHPNE